MICPHVVCDACNEWIIFGASLLTGQSIQTCRCGSKPVPLIRPPRTITARDPEKRQQYRLSKKARDKALQDATPLL